MTTQTATPHASLLAAAARGLALFFGLFTLLNLVAGLRNPGLDLNLWWIDLRPLPAWLSQPFLALAALALLAYAVGLRLRWLHPLTLITTALLLTAAIWNTITYYRLLSSGALYSGSLLPFSLLVALALGFIGLGLLRNHTTLDRRGRILLVAVFLASVAIFPAAQVYSFGLSDYRRPADAIVVFGAQARNDVPSLALRDRVRTACDLYHRRLARTLIFSGGPAEGSGHETEAMRHFALAHGIPDRAILLDRQGLNTRATVTNTIPILRKLRAHRVLAVSHFYHLPRIKLAYQQAGWNIYTVPAENPEQPAREYPYMVFRETAAMWAYYLRGSGRENH